MFAAILLPRLLPTPVLAFAVRHLDASAGVMVTASHNPANDNGYKVYLGGDDHGSQIVPPADGEIAGRILQVAGGSIVDLPRSDRWETASEDLVDAYIAASAAVAATGTIFEAEDGTLTWRCRRPPGPFALSTRPCTGWAGRSPRAHSRRPEFRNRSLCRRRSNRTPGFPTVPFPNPEEPGALKLAYAVARESDADLIIANDPDADRLAVAIPDSRSPEGFRRLSGNDVGALLGWRAAEIASRTAEADARPTGTLAASIVSSPALRTVAEAYGLDFAETLTGFKWVSRAPGIIFGFEEALGYLVNPGSIRDKDGISAAVAFLQFAGAIHAEGVAVAEQLDLFAMRFGYFASDQISIRVTDLSRIEQAMAHLREYPPGEVGGVAVARIDDLAGGFGGLPPSDVLRIRFEDGSRVMVRPSGTEPKLKVYLDASCDEGDLHERRTTANGRLAALAEGIRPLIES